VYTLASLGVGIREFYCCGKLESVKVTFTFYEKGECKDGNKEDCCKNKYQFFKVNDTHVAGSGADSPAKSFVEFDSFMSLLDFGCVNNTTLQHIGSLIHGPPLVANTPIYIHNCIFRI